MTFAACHPGATRPQRLARNATGPKGRDYCSRGWSGAEPPVMSVHWPEPRRGDRVFGLCRPFRAQFHIAPYRGLTPPATIVSALRALLDRCEDTPASTGWAIRRPTQDVSRL
jgi:hypothetical protein